MTRLLPLALCTALLAAGEAAPVVATVAASERPHATIELLPGTVRAEQAAVLMARIQGVVERIAATPGARVEAGAVLAEIDARELAAARDQAKAQAALAAADFARARRLNEQGTASPAEFDAAQARAAASAAAAAQAEVMLSYTRITAPFAGVVVRRHAEVGDLLAPGRAVVELEDPATLRLAVEVPETLAARLAPGATFAVQVPAAAFAGEAPVVEVVPAADPVTRSVLVKLALPAGTAGLRSGQFGRVGVPVAEGRVLAVPAAAVVRRGQLDAVFVVADGVARLRLVRLGASLGDAVAVRAGLSAGELVAVDPANLRDGQAVAAP
jgi:RND family efflux transporter MFP subunit